MPCSPPIRFCSIVGQASIHTARAIGPSTMERSRGLVGRGRAGAGMGEDSRSGPGLTPGVDSGASRSTLHRSREGRGAGTGKRTELRTMRFMMLVLAQGYEMRGPDFATPSDLVA